MNRWLAACLVSLAVASLAACGGGGGGAAPTAQPEPAPAPTAQPEPEAQPQPAPAPTAQPEPEAQPQPAPEAQREAASLRQRAEAAIQEAETLRQRAAGAGVSQPEAVALRQQAQAAIQESETLQQQAQALAPAPESAYSKATKATLNGVIAQYNSDLDISNVLGFNLGGNAYSSRQPVRFSPDYEFEPMASRNGVSMARGPTEEKYVGCSLYAVSCSDSGLGYSTAYVAFMESSYTAMVMQSHYREWEGVGTGGWNLMLPAQVYGNPTGSSPQINGTWTGIMAGFHNSGPAQSHRMEDLDPNARNLITGDASITVILGREGFASNTPRRHIGRIEASFTNIEDTVTGKKYSDIVFGDRFSDHVYLQRDGRFTQAVFENMRSSFHGGFYGPAHEEVGGSFTRNNIGAAFMGKQE